MKKFIIFALMFLAASRGYSDGYKKIVSLSPMITEELYLLGAEDKIAGVTTYCINPPDAKKKEKVGTVMEVNLEKIMDINPDVVIATPLSDERQISKMKSLGINVVRMPLAVKFSDLCGQFMQLGRFVGEDGAAKKIIQKAMQRVARVKEGVRDLPKVSVFVQVGSRPLCTMAGDSFVNDYIELAGGVNIAKDNKTVLYSRENVLRQDPDVIIIVTMGIEGQMEKDGWAKFKSLKAVRNNRVYIMDSYKMCSPTPASFAEMLEVLAAVIHE